MIPKTFVCKSVRNLLTFLYLVPLNKCSWNLLKEKMRVEFSTVATAFYALIHDK